VAPNELFHINNQSGLIYSPSASSHSIFQVAIEACVAAAQCHAIRLTLAISFSLELKQMQFLRPTIRIESASHQLELTKLIKHHQFHDFGQVRFQATGSAFELNPHTGFLFLYNDTSLDVTAFKTSGELLASTRLEITIKLSPIEFRTPAAIEKSVLVTPSDTRSALTIQIAQLTPMALNRDL
jgi:hypothetical protein